MLRVYFFSLFFFCFTLPTNANKSGTAPNITVIDAENDSLVRNKNDTVFVILSQENVSNNSIDWTYHMPWIGAIFVGLLTVLANILISKYSRKSSLNIAEKQINNAKEIALVQIENTSKNAQLDFNKTVISGNRQVWINDLRDIISKIITNILLISSNMIISPQEHENLKVLIIKAELMLNPQKDFEIISTLDELEKCCFDVLMFNNDMSELVQLIDKLKKLIKQKLKTEWERVKKGE